MASGLQRMPGGGRRGEAPWNSQRPRFPVEPKAPAWRGSGSPCSWCSRQWEERAWKPRWHPAHQGRGPDSVPRPSRPRAHTQGFPQPGQNCFTFWKSFPRWPGWGLSWPGPLARQGLREEQWSQHQHALRLTGPGPSLPSLETVPHAHLSCSPGRGELCLSVVLGPQKSGLLGSDSSPTGRC